jgi:hypothetical protein
MLPFGRVGYKFQESIDHLCYCPSRLLCNNMSLFKALRSAPLHRRRLYATVSNPQTVVEKIVQKYAVDLPKGAKVYSGDYVMIKPEHV